MCFSLMIAGLRRLNMEESNFVKNALFERMKSEHTSVLWKFAFFGIKFLHMLALLTLFIVGSVEINLYHLGLLFFFIFYISSQALYRKTSMLLVIFASFFIWG